MPFAGNDLVVVMLHLYLGERSRRRQLAYIAECLVDEQNVVLIGNMNSSVSNLLEGSPLQDLSLVPAHADLPGLASGSGPRPRARVTQPRSEGLQSPQLPGVGSPVGFCVLH